MLPNRKGEFLKAACRKIGIYIEGIHFHLLPKNQSVGVAIISKFPVLDSFSVYFNTPNYLPKKIGENDLLGEILNDVPADNLPGSRGLKHSVKSRCVLSNLIKVGETPVRLMTTHYTVSDLCTETEQMYKMSELIYSLVKNSKDIPTIFSADLNIRPQSYSVLMLSKVMKCHTLALTDTLAMTHVAKKKDFPQGLAIDHVFSKALEHKSTNTIDVTFSEHKALVSEFSL